jgi:cytidylate kinase
VERQRAIAAQGPVVMAGRDIGTVVLPDARYKFFLTASVDERARRRQAEFHERGLDVPFDEVRAQIVERDRLDSTRAVSPLRAADDAVTVDSTDLQPDEVVARMRAVMDGARA